MKPLNKKQRNAAILKFVLVYVFSVIILAVPVFAIFKIPEIECEVSNEQLNKLETAYNKCMKDKSALKGKSTLSGSGFDNLNSCYLEYSDFQDVYSDNIDALDGMLLNTDQFSRARIDSIYVLSTDMLTLKTKIEKINERFKSALDELKN
jgi:hypothetical protein